MTSKQRILLADDHAILRDGIRSLLSLEHDIEVVGEASNGKEAVNATIALNPDLVLMDISMPHSNGTEAIGQIKLRSPQTKIIILTLHKSEVFIYSSLKAGADGYVLKDDSHVELLFALRNVIAGKPYLSPSVCGQVISSFLDASSIAEKMPSWNILSPREREVIKLIAEGLRNKQIADYLSLSQKTIEKHRSNVMKKLGLRSTATLTSYVIENGLIG